MAEASSVRARRSSGSRSWTFALPQARASIWISSVIAWRKLATRSAASGVGGRFVSSGPWAGGGGFGGVDARFDPARDDDRSLAICPEPLEGLPRLAARREGRDTRVVL